MRASLPFRTTFAAAALACAVSSSACLVVSLHPLYDDQSIAWDEGLVGAWRDAEDNIDVAIDRGEWRSYRVRYRHPVDTGTFTAHLTLVENVHYLDLMPERGQDYGPLLVPVHAIVRVDRQGDSLTVTPLDYDRLAAAFKQRARGSGPAMAMDEKQNVFLTAPTAELRRWVRLEGSKASGAAATFIRAKQE